MTILRRAWLFPVLLFSGCERSVRVYDVAKEQPPTVVKAAAPAQPQASPAQAARADPSAIRWTVPASWKEKPGGGMRYATLVTDSGLEISVTVFPGTAGGMLPNVNRWRGQIALEPIDHSEFEKGSVRVVSRAGAVIVVDYSGAKLNGNIGDTTRLLAAILEKPERTWFFKINGDVDPVGAAKPSFLEFLKTLH